jgi:hypothetical protein
MSKLLEIKYKAKAKEDDELEKAQNRRDILILILHHFSKHGYIQSLDKLEQESGVSLKRWQAADNMDLLYMMHEFKEFYHLKYERPPKYVRKSNDADKEALDQAKKSRGRTNLPPVKSASSAASSGDEGGPGPGLNRQGTYGGDSGGSARREKENKKGAEMRKEDKPPKREGRDRFKVMDRSMKLWASGKVLVWKQ